MEDHFLKLLSEHLQFPLEVMVDHSPDSATEVGRRLQMVIGTLMSRPVQSVSGGFTEFVVSRRVVSFLESESRQHTPLPPLG